MENVTRARWKQAMEEGGGGGQVRLGKLLSLSHIRTWYSELILKQQKVFFFSPQLWEN